MYQNKFEVIALLPYNKKNELSENMTTFFFKNKNELIQKIKTMDFDILVSNGCPYILPVSQIKKQHQIFVNIHPSLLPNLRDPHPINGAIFAEEETGATCHIMDNDIDSGSLISQVNIHNKNIPLPLLYQMCFLAEVQVFDIAFKNNFRIQSDQVHKGIYFKRDDQNMLILPSDNLQTILKKVEAFNIKGQYAKLFYKGKKHSINSAKIIENLFLQEFYKNCEENTITLIYENYILIKRKDKFIELGIVNGVEDFAIKDNIFKQNQISIYQIPQYSSCLSQNNFEFTFSQDEQYFYNLSEISKIPHSSYYDMSSPYGYSGYFTNSLNLNFVKKAVEMQSIKAQKENIIAEFIRFNPYQNYQIFSNFLDFYTLEKQMVEVDMNYQRRWEGYQSRLKGKIRKSLSSLRIQHSNDIESFFKLYTQTMQRNRAQDFYFFSRDYFQKLSKLDGFVMFEAIYGKEICAMAIFLCDRERSFYHLGANSTLTLANNLNAMGAIFETFFQYAETRGIVSCLLGGGRTAHPDDSLLQYKKQYSPTLIDFYIGGKIYDQQIYQELSKKSDSNFFLKYRYSKGGGANKLTFLHQGGKCA